MPPRMITKLVANYHQAKTTYDRNRYCKDCSMFRHGSACTLVKGSIDPEWTCDNYEAKR